MFSVRYELNFYISFRTNSIFKEHSPMCLATENLRRVLSSSFQLSARSLQYVYTSLSLNDIHVLIRGSQVTQ
jgi:hypothetical protein